MRIKKFVDEDMIRLMRRVKEELGPEAVIVSTSQSEDGRSELVAAVETDEIEFADGAEPAVYAAAYSDNLIRERLDYHEADAAVRARLLALCRKEAAAGGEKDDVRILTAVFNRLFAAYDLLDRKNPVKVFAGLQGSGKTAALVKTAALACRKGIACTLISADGVRAGANAQLKSLAAVLSADFLAAREPEQLAAAVAGAEKGRLVLVDTPGTNPFLDSERERLSALLKAAGGETVLTLDAGYNACDAGEAAALFASLGADCLLPTKLDLCRRIGGVLTAALKGGFKLGRASVSASMANGLSEFDGPSLARLLLA